MATERQAASSPLTDRVAFAQHIYGQDWGTDELNLAPERYADVTRLMHELKQAVPALTDDPAARALFGTLGDTIYDLAGATASAGLRLGAACESFRAEIVPPTRICPDCLTMYGMETRDRATCTRC